MKTGFIIALVGIFGVFATAIYYSIYGHSVVLELLAILGGTLAAFGFLLMQFNGTRSTVSKTRKIIGLLFGVVVITSVILFVAAPTGIILLLCFVVLLFAFVFSGVAIPEPFV